MSDHVLPFDLVQHLSHLGLTTAPRPDRVVNVKPPEPRPPVWMPSFKGEEPPF